VVVTINRLGGWTPFDRDLIGRRTVVLGQANWEQDFGAIYELPSGAYRVEMLVDDPALRRTGPDGSNISRTLAASVHHFVVE
jgi:hypothetical protein